MSLTPNLGGWLEGRKQRMTQLGPRGGVRSSCSGRPRRKVREWKRLEPVPVGESRQAIKTQKTWFNSTKLFSIQMYFPGNIIGIL